MTQNARIGHLQSLWAQIDRPADCSGRLRVGIDVVDVGVMARQLQGSLGETFSASVFTPREVEDCRGRPERFATRWALKEAVSKAIGTGFRLGLRPGMIEVVTSASGAVNVQPAEGQRWPDGAEQWVWAASASHEAGLAAAIAVTVTAQQPKGSLHD